MSLELRDSGMMEYRGSRGFGRHATWGTFTLWQCLGSRWTSEWNESNLRMRLHIQQLYTCFDVCHLFVVPCFVFHTTLKQEERCVHGGAEQKAVAQPHGGRWGHIGRQLCCIPLHSQGESREAVTARKYRVLRRYRCCCNRLHSLIVSFLCFGNTLFAQVSVLCL